MVENDNVISLSKNLLQMKFMRRGDDHNIINPHFHNKKETNDFVHGGLLKSIPTEEHWYLSVAIPKYTEPDENVVVCDDFKVFDETNIFGRFSINGYNTDIQKFIDYHNKGASYGYQQSAASVSNKNECDEDISDGEMASRINAYTNKNVNKNKKAHKNKRNRKRKFKNKQENRNS